MIQQLGVLLFVQLQLVHYRFLFHEQFHEFFSIMLRTGIAKESFVNFPDNGRQSLALMCRFVFNDEASLTGAFDAANGAIMLKHLKKKRHAICFARILYIVLPMVRTPDCGREKTDGGIFSPLAYSHLAIGYPLGF